MDFETALGTLINAHIDADGADSIVEILDMYVLLIEERRERPAKDAAAPLPA